MPDAESIMRSAVSLMAPAVQSKYGPLPYYELQSYAGKSPLGTPFSIWADTHQRVWCIRYYPARLVSSLKERGPAHLLLQTGHELIHLYNEQLRWLAAGLQPFESEYSSDDYRGIDPSDPLDASIHWSEGVVEMALLALAMEIAESGELEALFQTLCTKLELKPSNEGYRPIEAIAASLGMLLATLVRYHRVEEPTLRSMGWNIPTSPRVSQLTDYYASLWAKDARYNLSSSLPYALGLYRCARLVANGVPLERLLVTPMTNRQLREAARRFPEH